MSTLITQAGVTGKKSVIHGIYSHGTKSVARNIDFDVMPMIDHMPELPDSHKPRQYTIGEAADILGVSIPTIRMYEREGLVIPHRKNSRHRRFSDTDVERIRCIRKMINEEKVSIAGIRMLLALIPCWKIKNCPDDARTTCSAFHQTSGACWMASNKAWNCRSAECRECSVYTQVASCATLKRTIAGFTLAHADGTYTSPDKCELPTMTSNQQ